MISTFATGSCRPSPSTATALHRAFFTPPSVLTVHLFGCQDTTRVAWVRSRARSITRRVSCLAHLFTHASPNLCCAALRCVLLAEVCVWGDLVEDSPLTLFRFRSMLESRIKMLDAQQKRMEQERRTPSVYVAAELHLCYRSVAHINMLLSGLHPNMEALWTNRAQWEQVLAIVFGAGMLRLRGGRPPACMMLHGARLYLHRLVCARLSRSSPTPHPLQSDVWSR